MPTWFEHLIHAVTGRISAHDGLPDLRELPSERVPVERTPYLVNDRERRSQDDRLYVLRREPRSRRHDAEVAVYSNGRGVGYLSRTAAQSLAATLDGLGGAAIVNGAGSKQGSIRLWVDVPTSDALAGALPAA
ncbi:hypothetical protein AB3M83_10475 [Microbacterium sp. 179-B 1A2 NHS]|uniref:hypothetical protein n=1 Tax=Microbacterium sp. 179-B 1A2 NHS TaxID=3142383 RepID=UPI0039A37434